MTNITPHPEFEYLIAKIQELEKIVASLVNNRDNILFHTNPTLQAEYMLKIGKIEYAIFEYQCKILRVKRKIEIIQSYLNKDQPYNLDDIERQLDQEYHEYTQKLKEKQKEIEKARLISSCGLVPLSKEDSAELRKMYIEIVKKLHPDINSDPTEEQHGQYIDAVNAYKKGDLIEMRVIYLLLEKTIGFTNSVGNSLNRLRERSESLSKLKDHLTNEINEIKERFPYNVMNLLSKKEKLQIKITELSNQLTDCGVQYTALDLRLQEILDNE